MPLDVRRIAHASPEYDTALALRHDVMRAPLGLEFTPEDLASDALSAHFAAFLDGRMVGTAVVTPYGNGKVKLRQMTVADGMRGAKVGEHMLTAMEAYARSTGIREIVLEARVTAQGFYARYGYITDDVVFTQVTIPHVKMWKVL